MNATNVFVYGTLKRGQSQRGLDRWGNGAEFVGQAVTSQNNYSLWNLGAFPAVSSGESRIAGEVWSVDNETLADLDRIEGHPDFYKRIEVNTTQGKAWMYYIPDIDSYQSELINPDKNNISVWRNQ